MNKPIRYTYPKLVLLIFITLQLVGNGCATSPAAHFYLLSITGQGSSNIAAAITPDERVIGIGPVRLPEYLDRPQIVTRSDNTELYLSELHRWAEPLQENFTRVLAEQISQMMRTDNISIEPSRNRNDLDLRILADVIQFDTNVNGEVTLVTYWRVENKDGTNRINTRQSPIRLDISRHPGTRDLVEGLSQAVFRLAREISSDISLCTANKFAAVSW